MTCHVENCNCELIPNDQPFINQSSPGSAQVLVRGAELIKVHIIRTDQDEIIDNSTKNNMKQDSPSRTSKRSSSTPLPSGLIPAAAVVALLSLSSTTTAFQPVAIPKTSTKQRTGTSILHYRYLTSYTGSSTTLDNNTEEDQPILMQLANGNLAMTEGTIVSSSASSFLQMMAAQDNDLSAMDEYLEYVDKRYARMHPPPQQLQQHHHQVSLSSSSSPAAVVATAVHNMSTSSSSMSRNKDDDRVPLKKLGLSRLASTRLRNRLRQQHNATNSTTMSLFVRYVGRTFFRPLSYLCGVLLVVLTFARGNGYRAWWWDWVYRYIYIYKCSCRAS